MVTTHAYHCINKRCPKYHVEFRGPSPAEWRAAVGSALYCAFCGKVLRWLRAVIAEAH